MYQPPLQDTSKVCSHVLDIPGLPILCQLPAGHEGKHQCGGTTWSTTAWAELIDRKYGKKGRD